MIKKRPHNKPPPTTFRQNYVEIFVGVTILGILAAIILPVLTDARQQARAVSCLNNGKDLSRALLMYAQDYDSHLPLAKTWYDIRDTKNRLRCPELPNPNRVGYALDSRLARRSLHQIGQDHATRPLLCESSNFDLNAHDAGTSFAARHRYKGASQGWIAFVDGHVREVKESQGKQIVQRGAASP